VKRISDADHPHIALISNIWPRYISYKGNLQEARRYAEEVTWQQYLKSSYFFIIAALF